MNNKLKDNVAVSEAEENIELELDKLKKEAQGYLEGWKRAQADFTNFKKDEERRIASILKFGNESLLLEILGEVDNLETALAHIPEEITEKYKDWSRGLEHVKKGFMEMLSRHSIERIRTEKEKFDPSLHEAIEGEGETIKEEVQAGYTLNGKVIRPARVRL